MHVQGMQGERRMRVHVHGGRASLSCTLSDYAWLGAGAGASRVLGEA